MRTWYVERRHSGEEEKKEMHRMSGLSSLENLTIAMKSTRQL